PPCQQPPGETDYATDHEINHNPEQGPHGGPRDRSVLPCHRPPQDRYVLLCQPQDRIHRTSNPRDHTCYDTRPGDLTPCQPRPLLVPGANGCREQGSTGCYDDTQGADEDKNE